MLMLQLCFPPSPYTTHCHSADMAISQPLSHSFNAPPAEQCRAEVEEKEDATNSPLIYVSCLSLPLLPRRTVIYCYSGWSFVFFNSLYLPYSSSHNHLFTLPAALQTNKQAPPPLSPSLSWFKLSIDKGAH